jgi:hypothetical protein
MILISLFGTTAGCRILLRNPELHQPFPEVHRKHPAIRREKPEKYRY